MSGAHSHGTGAFDNADAVRAVIVSGFALGVAAAVEFWTALAGHSAGVLADAFHNSGDVLTTFVLLASFALARRPANRRFTSGFGRIEDVATLLIIVVIVVTAAAAAVASVQKFFHPGDYGSYGLSILAAGVGVVANLAVSEFKIRVGRGLNSTALQADGVHSRIDALVSAGAAIGIGLAWAGYPIADPIAGVGITLMIVYALAGTVRDLFLRMMDAVDPHLVDDLTETAARIEGVLAVHDVRARWVGRDLVAVMHIDCDPDSSLREAHAIVLRVEHAVEHSLPIARLTVHTDPGTDHHHHEPSGHDADHN